MEVRLTDIRLNITLWHCNLGDSNFAMEIEQETGSCRTKVCALGGNVLTLAHEE